MMKRIFVLLVSLLFLWGCSKAPTESERKDLLPIISLNVPDTSYADQKAIIEWETYHANEVKITINDSLISNNLTGEYSRTFGEGIFTVKSVASNDLGTVSEEEDMIVIREYPIDVEIINKIVEQTVTNTLTISLDIPITGYYRTKTFIDYSTNQNEDFYLRVSCDNSNWFGPTNPTEGSYKKVYDNGQEGVNGRYSGIFHLESGMNYIQIIAFNEQLFIESIQFEFVGEQ